MSETPDPRALADMANRARRPRPESAQRPPAGADTIISDVDAAADRTPEIEGAQEAYRILGAAIGRLTGRVERVDPGHRGEREDAFVSRNISAEHNNVYRTAVAALQLLGPLLGGARPAPEQTESIALAIQSAKGLEAALDAIVVRSNTGARAGEAVSSGVEELSMQEVRDASDRIWGECVRIAQEMNLTMFIPGEETTYEKIEADLEAIRLYLQEQVAADNPAYYAYTEGDFQLAISDLRGLIGYAHKDASLLPVARHALEKLSETMHNLEDITKQVKTDKRNRTFRHERLMDLRYGVRADQREGSADGGAAMGAAETGTESLRNDAEQAKDRIYTSLAILGGKLGIVMLPPHPGPLTTDERAQINTISIYLREANLVPDADTAFFRATFDRDYFERYISNVDPPTEDHIRMILSTLGQTVAGIQGITDAIDSRSIDRARVQRILEEQQAFLSFADAQPAPRAGRERTPRRPESPEDRERADIQRALFMSDPLSGEPTYLSPIFDGYLRQMLTRDGQAHQWDMLIERINAVVMNRPLQAPRDAGIRNPPHPLSEPEYIEYIRRAAEQTQRYMNLERQASGTITFDSGDTISYEQVQNDDGLNEVTILVPRSMVSQANAIPPDVKDDPLPVRFTNINLSEAVLGLIQQAGLTGSDGNMCTYSRANANPLRRQKVPFTSWIMSFIPGTNARRTKKEQIGRRKAAQKERQSGRLKSEMEGRALRDLGTKVASELAELRRRGTLTDDEVSQYLALHDEVSTYLRRPFGDISPDQKRIEGRVTEALRNLRAEPILAELRAKGLEQLSAAEIDSLSSDQAIEELGSQPIDHYLQFLGSSGFSKFMKFPRNSDQYKDYLIVQNYLDEHIERRELIATLEAGIGKEMRKGIEAQRGVRLSPQERNQIEAREGQRIREALERRIGDRFTEEEYGLFLGYYRLSFLQRFDKLSTTRAERKAEKTAFDKVNAVLQALIGFNRLSDDEARKLGELESSGASGDDVDDYLRSAAGQGVLGSRFKRERSRFKREPVRRIANEMAGVRFETGFQHVIDTLKSYWKPAEIAELQNAITAYSRHAFAQGTRFGDLNARNKISEYERNILDRAAADFELLSQWDA